MKKLVRFTVGAFLGAAIAGITVILLTPQSGKDIRTKLGEKISYVRSQVKNAVEQQRHDLEKEWNAEVDEN